MKSIVWWKAFLFISTALLLPLYSIARVDENGEFFGWIDPDTKKQHHHTKAYSTGEDLTLVMSDEFEKEGRTFKDGADPMWTALDKSDDDQTAQGKRSLQYYDSNMITTRDGKLVISTSDEDTTWHQFNPYKKKIMPMTRHFKSGMLMGWDKFCFTGGVIEINLKLPGKPDIGGLWPAIWLFGNLGRATYEQSTNKMWPWSYKQCDRKKQKAQEISGCDITEHFDMHALQGRGATEIDILEVMSGPSTKMPIVKNNLRRPYSSMTLQLAPGVPASNRPPVGTLPEWGPFLWYNNLTYGHNVSINPFFYGTFLGTTKSNEPIHRTQSEAYQCDAIGSIMQLDDTYWTTFTTFRLEWEPGDDGYLRWYTDGNFKFGINGHDIHNVSGGSIPSEPSYIILNTAISTSWGFPTPPWGCNDYDCKTTTGRCGFNRGFCEMISPAAEFLIDSVRVYQRANSNDNDNDYDSNSSSTINSYSDKSNKNKNTHKKPLLKKKNTHTLGCNPREYPTRKFIQAHEYRYMSSVAEVGEETSSGRISKGASQETVTVSKKPIQHGGAPCSTVVTAIAKTSSSHEKEQAKSGTSTTSSTSTSTISSSSNTCGEEQEAGFCGIFGKCTCRGIWTGPNCKVPAYQNDFPDWEHEEEWSMVTNVVWPHLPSSVWIMSAMFMLLFLLATRLLAYRRSSADPTDTGTDTGIGMGMSIGMGLSGNSSLENSPKAGPGSSTDSAKFGNGYGYGYSGLYLDTMAGEKRESGGEGYGEDEDEEEVENTFYAASAGTATRAGGWFSGLFSFSEGWSAGKDNETELTSTSTGAEGVGVRGGQKGYQSMS